MFLAFPTVPTPTSPSFPSITANIYEALNQYLNTTAATMNEATVNCNQGMHHTFFRKDLKNRGPVTWFLKRFRFVDSGCSESKKMKQMPFLVWSCRCFFVQFLFNFGKRWKGFSTCISLVDLKISMWNNRDLNCFNFDFSPPSPWHIKFPPKNPSCCPHQRFTAIYLPNHLHRWNL